MFSSHTTAANVFRSLHARGGTLRLGEDKRIDRIKVADAKAWRVWLATEGNRRDKNRKTMADNTVRRRIGKAKQFFDHAITCGLIDDDPFKSLPSTVHGNAKRQSFVERETIDDCIAATPDARWRAIIALARYGGLRCPSDLATLTWDMIDFANGRVTIRAPKKEHLACGGRRVCPLFPELRPYLEDLHELAVEGDPQVIPDVGAASNLRTTMEKIIARAGHNQWPKLFQNLRASRETELLGQFPAKDVTDWLGNGVAVAMKHYAMAHQSSFDAAATTPTGPLPATDASKGEAKPEAVAKQKAKQTPPAKKSHDSPTEEEIPQKRGSSPPLATCDALGQKASMGDEGLDIVADSSGNSNIAGLGEAESEAIRMDANLRDLLRLWSTLSDDVKLAIMTVARAYQPRTQK